MNNTELTLDQLSEVASGTAFMKLGDIKGEYCQIVHPAFKKFKMNRSLSRGGRLKALNETTN